MDLLSSGQTDVSARVITVVVPVAVYFLIIGLLNSRRHPQLLSGRSDFALLLIALSPLFVVPAFGASTSTLLAAAAVAGGLILMLMPRRNTWVIYNLSPGEARSAVQRALVELDLAAQVRGYGFHIPGLGADVRIGGFPLLRNVSISLHGGSRRLAGRLGRNLGRTVSGIRAQTSPMAAALLLVGTAMLIAPLAVVAQRVPEIVRILTDLLH